MAIPIEYDDLVALAVSGDIQAMVGLAIHHQTQGNVDTTIAWHRRAAEAGHVPSMAYLGWVYELRDDRDDAASWYRLAVDAGNSDAAKRLSEVQRPRDTSSPNSIMLAHMSRKMAETAESLGNFDQAKGHWNLAADEGDTDAMYRIGLLEERSTDLGHAILWYEHAARRGNIESEQRLRLIRPIFGP